VGKAEHLVYVQTKTDGSSNGSDEITQLAGMILIRYHHFICTCAEHIMLQCSHIDE